ncbi:hypothetical protein BH11BAC3_BH11BAC3_37140 [soil metagenome]
MSDKKFFKKELHSSFKMYLQMKSNFLLFILALLTINESFGQDWRYVKHKKVYRDLDEAIKEKDSVFNLELFRGNVKKDRLHLIGELKHIEFLSISEAGLDSIPDEIFTLPNIRTLNLTKNNFITMPAGISKLKKLEYLVMYDNEITIIPDWIGMLTRLETLILPRNKIDSISPEIGKLKHLIDLSLGENQLQFLPAGIGGITSLVELDLHQNMLRSLPDEIGKLSGLKYLSLGGNKLNKLSSAFKGLIHLKILHLSDNNLSELPPVVGSFRSLQSLTLEKNPFESWNHEIPFSTQLEYVELSGKNITQFPANLQPCKKLTKIVITKTAITELPDWIGNFPKLYWLELDDNQIRHLPSSMKNLKSCEILRLANNNIEEVAANILLIPKLRILSIASNPINHFPQAMLNSKSLESLSIGNTNISYDEYKQFRRKLNKKIDIGHDSPVYFEDEEKPCYTEDSLREGDHIFRKLENDPQFVTYKVGKINFFSSNVSFDKIIASTSKTRDTILTDTVSLKFIVRRAGGLSNIMCVSGTNEAAKTEAIRLLKLSCPYWAPSNMGGRNINAWFQQSFVFTITSTGGAFENQLKVFNPIPATIRTIELQKD